MSSDLASLTGIGVPTRLLIGGEWTSGHGGRGFMETRYIAAEW